MKKILLTGMMLCLTASMALASGLNINWVTNTVGNCSATVGANRTWDCTADGANDGDFNFVISFVPNVALPLFNAVEIVIDGQSDAPLSPWWEYYNDGSCRPEGFSAELPPLTPLTPCATKLYSSSAYGGMGLWAINGNRLRTVLGYAMGVDRPTALTTTTQYNTMHMHVMTGKSIDVPEDASDPENIIPAIPACAGCDQPVTLVLQQIGIYGNGTPASDTIILPGTLAGSQRSITWQGGGTSPIPVPTRNTTWGQVKSLYR